jgi:UDP-N-acetylmuramyl tripeptide synthase
MWTKFSVVVGKIISHIVRIASAGSAFPGRLVEIICPHFLAQILSQLPMGVIVVTGTNGKTTTTMLIGDLLRAHGLRVFTNRSGSNMTRGIISSLLAKLSWSAHLDYDIAVLELDELYSVELAAKIAPDYGLVLNLFRDQLDRYGEIDSTSKILEGLVRRVRRALVLNREDPYVRRLDRSARVEAKYFGVSSKIRLLVKNDDELYSNDDHSFEYLPFAEFVLTDYQRNLIEFNRRGQETTTVNFRLLGVHNALNAIAALTLTDQVLGEHFDLSIAKLALAKARPAFGRGEVVQIKGRSVEILLVKNPSGFRYALQDDKSTELQRMIAINDDFADGRDVSWLWDVDFRGLSRLGVEIISGTRAADMALRLAYDEVRVGRVLPNLPTALNYALGLAKPLRIYCTYTAMLALRQALGKLVAVKAIEL